MNKQKQLQHHIHHLKASLAAQKQAMLFCVAAVFFWGFLAHGYGFLHNNLSHDVLNAFLATTTEEKWKIELGRFIVPFYRSFFRNLVSLPWLIGILGLAWTSIAVFLTIKLFDLRSRVLKILVAGIMVTNITNIGQVAAYIYEFDFNCFALLFSVLAAYLWDRGKGFPSILIGSLCVMISIGIYQAYFAVTLTLIIGKSLLDLLEGMDVRKVLYRGLRALLMVGIGGILYLLAGKLIYGITGIQPQERTDALALNDQNPLLLYLDLVQPALEYFVENILHVVYDSLGFLLAFYGVLALLTLSLVRIIIVRKFRFDRILLIVVLLALLPFAMSSIYFLAKGNGVHDLMNYAFWFTYIFIGLFAFRLCWEDMTPVRCTQALPLIASILLGVIIWQNVVVANTAYVKKELEANATLSTMTRVVARLEQQEDYVPKETPVAFVGTYKHAYVFQGAHEVSSIVGLSARTAIPRDTSLYFYNAYQTYFAYVLQYPVQFCSNDVHKQLKQDPRVEAMPAFPHQDCMEMIDGVLVIKMG